jgi:hypothetical protein
MEWEGLTEIGHVREFNYGDIVIKQCEPSEGLFYVRTGK